MRTVVGDVVGVMEREWVSDGESEAVSDADCVAECVVGDGDAVDRCEVVPVGVRVMETK